MKIIDIALKDLTRSFRSAFAVGMAVIAPLLLVGLIYFALGGALSGEADLPAVTVGLVNSDSLPAGAPLDKPLGEHIRDMFYDQSVESWITPSDYPDEASARAALDAQQVGVAVVIPAGFSERFLAGERDIQVLVISDPTLSIAPQVVQNMVSAMLDGVAGGGVAIQTLMERSQAAGTQPDPAQLPALVERYTNWYANFQQAMFHNPERAALAMVASSAKGENANPTQNMLGLMMAGQMAFFAFFTGAYSMTSILREDEEGTLARLFTTPVNRSTILAGKFAAVIMSVIVQSLVLIVATRFAFGIKWGEPAPVALAVAGQVFAAAGLGVMLISFTKTSQQSGPVLGGGLTVLGMLGGLFTTGLEMPEAFTRLAVLTPQGWVIRAWKIVLSGGTSTELLTPFAVLLIIGIVMFAIGALVFRNRFS